MDKVKGLMDKARFLFNRDIKAFVKDQFHNYYFCNILDVNETHLVIYNFIGKRAGIKESLSWVDIETISEYKEDKN